MRQLILLLFPLCAWCQAPQFVLTDLGLLPQLGACAATSISQSGKVGGFCHAAGAALSTGPATTAFLYSQGTLTALPNPTGTTIASGVNDLGTVVGVSLPTGTDVATALTNTLAKPYAVQTLTSQPSIVLPATFWPAALNNSSIAGFVASNSGLANLNGILKAAVFTNGQQVNLPGTGNTLALGLSPQGVAAGGTISVDLATLSILVQAATWKNNVLTTLPALAAAPSAVALAANDNGVAGGLSFTLNIALNLVNPLSSFTFTNLHAVVWDNGASTDLNTALGAKNAVVTGVNKSGWAIGFRGDTLPGSFGVLNLVLPLEDANARAFLYATGKAYDLNNLVTNNSGWNVTNATALNDSGQIVGIGYLNGVEHAILLTPSSGSNVPAIGGIAGGGLSVPQVTSISPNGYFTIGGSNFAPAGTVGQISSSDIVNAMFPTKLASTCVNVGTTRAFLSYVSPNQINAIAPAVPPGTAAVTVVANCGTANEVASPPFNVTVAAASPEFLYWVQNTNGQNPVIAVDAVMGDYIASPGTIAGLNFRLAHAGDVLTLYGIGFGRTGAGPVPGLIPSAADSVPSGFSVTIGGKAANVSYVGVTPNSAGLYQVNLTVPTGLTAGNNSVVLNVNGVTTPAGGFLAVGP